MKKRKIVLLIIAGILSLLVITGTPLVIISIKTAINIEKHKTFQNNNYYKTYIHQIAENIDFVYKSNNNSFQPEDIDAVISHNFPEFSKEEFLLIYNENGKVVYNSREGNEKTEIEKRYSSIVEKCPASGYSVGFYYQ